jgi:peptide subunit release factor 1 (eRF1)
MVRGDRLIRDLQSLGESSGPFVSLCLNTEAERELGPQELQTRWRGLRDQLADDSVPDKALSLLDDVVDGSHLKGDGLVAITSGEELAFRRFLSSPLPDSIRSGALPHLLPLLDHGQEHPSYAVVLIDRTGAEIHVIHEMGDDETFEIEGEDDELRKVGPGGWSQRRFQNRAEDSWERNAEQVATELDRIVRSEGLDLVLTMGDVRAKAFLKDNAGQELAAVLHEVDTAPPTSDRLEEVRGEIEAAVAELTANRIEGTLERFAEERGQNDLVADGMEATFAALRMSQVDTLLISREIEGQAWFHRGDPMQGAIDKTVLDELGLDDIQDAAAEDVLVTFALATGASVSVIPDLGPESGPREGVGALLRFRTEEPSS